MIFTIATYSSLFSFRAVCPNTTTQQWVFDSLVVTVLRKLDTPRGCNLFTLSCWWPQQQQQKMKRS